ncbi:MAG: hypothetical protein A2189_05110 [Paenibacillus sp. RIFOXYA1_FULL_44_5]|nr:MAG: hypothetical protein A2189_05110 [Paenibacillus sp. RIFOXYA1_FULL_44_5]
MRLGKLMDRGKTAENQQEIILYPSTGKLLRAILLSVLFVAAGVFVLETQTLWIWDILVIPGILFFGAGMLILLYRLINKKPSHVINEEGIWFNPSRSNKEQIKWEDIQNLTIQQISRQRFIGIDLHNMEQFLSTRKAWRKKLIQFNAGLIQAPIIIGESLLSMKLEELHSLMLEMWEKAK